MICRCHYTKIWRTLKATRLPAVFLFGKRSDNIAFLVRKYFLIVKSQNFTAYIRSRDYKKTQNATNTGKY